MIIPQSNYEKSTAGTEKNYLGKLQSVCFNRGLQKENQAFTLQYLMQTVL